MIDLSFHEGLKPRLFPYIASCTLELLLVPAFQDLLSAGPFIPFYGVKATSSYTEACVKARMYVLFLSRSVLEH